MCGSQAEGVTNPLPGAGGACAGAVAEDEQSPVRERGREGILGTGAAGVSSRAERNEMALLQCIFLSFGPFIYIILCNPRGQPLGRHCCLHYTD